jgi:RNase P protein component
MQSLLVIRTVKFDERMTVYELNDWSADVYLEARREQWMQHAVDRHRFKRRVKETEIELGNIF